MNPPKVVITRSHEGNLELASRLEKLGIRALPLDLLSFAPPESWDAVDSSLKSLGSYDWVLFTSSTGAKFFAERMRSLGIDTQWVPPPRVGAVGEGTAEALKREGVRVDFTPRRFLAAALAEELPQGTGRVLLLRADRASKAPTQMLLQRGFSVDDVPIYNTKGRKAERLPPMEDADAIVFASPSAVESFCEQLSPSELMLARRKTAACIGPVTAAAAREHGFASIVQPDSHTFDSLLDLLRREV